ncbi:MAG: hypothetical protein GXO29_04385 [Thermotogae bacterium]|nr:hypothetical protein [Thermotogota bacterium]
MRYRHELFLTLLLVLYSLSFAVVDGRLLQPALIMAAVSAAFFPICLLVSYALRMPPLERNLLLPLDIALAVGAITNVISIGSTAFFAIMFVSQVFILAIGFMWSAYECTREGRTMQFMFAFLLWFLLLSAVGKAIG